MADNLNKNFLKILLYLKEKMAALIVVIVIIVFMSISSPHFLTLANFINILKQSSIIGIIAAGMTLVILLGGIDLSVGSILSFSSFITAELIIIYNCNIIITIIIGLLVGALLGYINGFIITKFSLRPFIVTLAMMGIIRGFTYICFEGESFYSFPEEFKKLADGFIGIVPIPIIIMVLIYSILYILLNRTNLGRIIYAIGDNEKAALFIGIQTKKYKLLAYLITGILSALAGLILAARVNVVVPTVGEGLELDVIAAVVIGGTSLGGGRGNVFGSFLGALMMGIVKNSLNLLLVSSHWQRVILGITIITAVSIDIIGKNKENRFL